MNKKLVFVTVCALILFQACASPSPAQDIEPTMTATLVPPTPTSTPTITPTSTPIPLAWTQVYDGQDFEHDTVTAFATDKTDLNVIYAGMKNSGVYKTVDEGLSWSPVNQGLASKKVESLLIDSENPLILYAGTIGGIFKTEDGGQNWSRIGDGTYLLMDWEDGSHLYARDENAIYETIDQGNTWEVMHSLKKDCPDSVSAWAIHPMEGNILFVSGGEECAPGVYQSTNNSRSWSLLGMEGKPNIDPIAIGVDEEGNYSIYVQHISLLGGDFHGVYTSHDEGLNWRKSEGNFGCGILATDPDDPSEVYCTGTSPTSLYVLKGKGSLWKAIPGTNSIYYTATHVDNINDVDRIITSGTDVSRQSLPYVSIFISADNGASWHERNNGLGSARAEIKIDPTENTKMYLGAHYRGQIGRTTCRLYGSQDSGINWFSMKANLDWCGPSFDKENTFYLVELDSIQKSFNGGLTWLWKEAGDSYTSESAPYRLPSWEKNWGARSISVNPTIDGLIYDAGSTVYYSQDAGVSWNASTGSEDLLDARLFYTDQSEMIFAIGRYHQKYSTDNGMTWRACGEDVTTAQSDSRLALDLQGERLYLATPGQGVLVSTDKCGSWQESNNGLGNLFVNTVAMDPKDNNILYAGTDGGAYVTFDGGATWGQINDGLVGSDIIYSIAVDSESNVYAATPYGVFKLEGR